LPIIVDEDMSRVDPKSIEIVRAARRRGRFFGKIKEKSKINATQALKWIRNDRHGEKDSREGDEDILLSEELDIPVPGFLPLEGIFELGN
jgi:hypothetical protein